MECIFNWRDYCRPDTDFKYAAKEITIRATVVWECRHVINREKEENTILPFLGESPLPSERLATIPYIRDSTVPGGLKARRRKRIQDEGLQSFSFFYF